MYKFIVHLWKNYVWTVGYWHTKWKNQVLFSGSLYFHGNMHSCNLEKIKLYQSYMEFDYRKLCCVTRYECGIIPFLMQCSNALSCRLKKSSSLQNQQDTSLVNLCQVTTWAQKWHGYTMLNFHVWQYLPCT